MINPMSMVRADIRRHRFSSLGILLLLSLAFSGTIAVSLFERGLRNAGVSVAKDTDLVVGAPGSELQLVLGTVYLQTNSVLPLLPHAVLEKLQADKRVALLSPLVFADHYGEFPIVGIGPDYPALRPGLRLGQGRWPQANFEITVGAACLLAIGQSFTSSHGISRQDGVEETGHAKEAQYTVVGRLAPSQTPADRCLFTPYQSLWEIHEEGSAHTDGGHEDNGQAVSAILVKPRSFADAYALRAAYKTSQSATAFPGEILAGLFAVFEDIRTAFTWLSVAFQAIVLAAVILSLLASLPTRSRWIGLLRSLGAGRLYIFLSLWIPSALVFLLAGCVGSLFGYLSAAGLGGFVENRTGLHLSLNWSWQESLCIGIFWLAGLAGALLPAWLGFRASARSALLGRD